MRNPEPAYFGAGGLALQLLPDLPASNHDRSRFLRQIWFLRSLSLIGSCGAFGLCLIHVGASRILLGRASCRPAASVAGQLGNRIEVYCSTREKYFIITAELLRFSRLPKPQINSPDEFNGGAYSWSPYPALIPRCYLENPSFR